MSFKEFSKVYRRDEDIYYNFIGRLTCVFKLILKLACELSESDRHFMKVTERFLKDFYSIEDTDVASLEEFSRVTMLDIAYTKVLKTA